MGYSLAEIADALNGKAFGDVDLQLERACEPAVAGPGDLAIAMSPKYAQALASGRAVAAVVWQDADWQQLGLKGAIVIDRPRVAMSGLTRMFDSGMMVAAGIHPTAVIDPSAVIGPGASIGALVVIGQNAAVGKNAMIDSHVSIGADVNIGDNALIHSGVRINSNTTIGNNFIAQSGCVIGSDGFSFVTPEKSGVEAARETLGQQDGTQAQPWMRIHSLGGVEIDDDVEIGANATIDQGTIRATRIGQGTKLDNQVHLGHNVVVGKDCLLCGQVGIAGSTTIGNNVVLGGQVGASDNIFIGDGVVAAGGTKIVSNAPAGRVLMGYPAVKMDTQIESYKALRRLPRLFRDVRNLQKIVSKNDDTA